MNDRNLLIALCGAVLILAAMAGPILVRQKQTYRSAFLETLTGANLLYLLGVGLEAAVEGRSGEWPFRLMYAANFLQYSMLYLLSFIAMRQLLIIIREKKQDKEFGGAVLWFYLIPAALLIGNRFNHMFFYIGDDNLYYRGKFFLLSQVIGLAAQLVILIIFLKYRNIMHHANFVLILPLAILPSIAVVVQILVNGINVMCMANTLSCIIIMIGVVYRWKYIYYQRLKELEQLQISIRLGNMSAEFVSNTLSAISQLCINDPETASLTIDNFADYLRKSMNDRMQGGEESFESELQHLKNYLSLERMRYGEDLEVEYEIEDTEFSIPVLVLNLAVDYMIRFIMAKSEQRFRIRVHSYQKRRKHRLDFEAVDQLIAVKQTQEEDESKLLLEDIRAQIERIPGAQVYVEQRIGKHPGLKIRIPIQVKTENDPTEGWSTGGKI